MNEIRAYKRAKTLVEQRFGFFVHLAVFVPVVALILFLDRFFTSPGQPSGWAWIVAWAWGIALTTHALAVHVLADTRSHTPLEQVLRSRRNWFFLHLFAYFNVVILLVVVNLSEATGPEPSSLHEGLVYYWWIWPSLFWGIGVFYHWFFSFLLRGWRVKKMKQVWTLKVMREIDGVDRPEKLENFDAEPRASIGS